MAKFKRISTVVECEQWLPGKQVKGVICPPEELGDTAPYVVTIHNQKVFIEPGDWILPEPDGLHYYPVKPEIFVNTYEPA